MFVYEKPHHISIKSIRAVESEIPTLLVLQQIADENSVGVGGGGPMQGHLRLPKALQDQGGGWARGCGGDTRAGVIDLVSVNNRLFMCDTFCVGAQFPSTPWLAQ